MVKKMVLVGDVLSLVDIPLEEGSLQPSSPPPSSTRQAGRQSLKTGS